MLEKREFDQNDFLFRLFAAITVVAGLFSFVVFTLLVVNYMQIRSADPVNHMLLTELRQEYAATPQKDELLAKRIQELDLLTRKAFFTSQAHLRLGGTMLFIGVCVFLVSFKNMLRWKRDKPKLADSPTYEQEFLALAKSRQLITWGGVGMLAVGMLAAVLTQSALVNGPDGTVVAAAPDAAPGAIERVPPGEDAPPPFEPPTLEDMQKNWPSFRGPASSGVASFANAPTEWDVEAGTNIRWKTELDLTAPNSPVIWSGKIYFSAADDDGRYVYCYDADSGEQVWKQTLPRFPTTPPELPGVTEETGYAAPTMAVHGGLAMAIFANGDLACYDESGTLRWGKNLGLPENHYGHSSSLIAWDDKLFVQFDDSSSPKVIALNVATGEEVWSTPRETICWASPVIAQTAFGPQLLLNSETTVDAYDPTTGTLLWSQECLSGEVAPSPAYANGMVFAANEFAIAAGIELTEGEGGAQPKLAWEYDEYLPEVASPVGDGERFYFCTAVGDIVCLDAKSGEQLWVQEVEDGFYSSPILVGDKLYATDMSGNLYIVRAASEFEMIATHAMGAEIFSTPAFVDGRMYVRTPEHLICIEAPAGEPAATESAVTEPETPEASDA